MTHDINAERVSLQLRRGTLIALLLLLDSTSDSFMKAAEQGDEERNRKQSAKYTAIHDELKEQLVKHEDKAKLKGWRV